MKQLLNPKLIADVKKAIKKCNSNPKDFCFEILDIQMCEGSTQAMANINSLIEMGFGVALDKFGHDVENPSILETFPCTHIKFDKRFLTRSMTSAMAKSLVNTIIDHANEKNITVIADAIEKQEELDYLRSLGINYFQGYYFSPPKDKQAFISDVMFTPWTNPDREIAVYKAPEKTIQQKAIEAFNSENDSSVIDDDFTEDKKGKKGKKNKKEKRGEEEKQPKPEDSQATGQEQTVEAPVAEVPATEAVQAEDAQHPSESAKVDVEPEIEQSKP
jgi:hypothetical protein